MSRERDALDRIRKQWSQARPDIDTSAMAVIGRVSRLSRIIDKRLAADYADHGLEAWMFDVLATLRRGGEPFELTAGELVSQTMVTTGAMTNRIDRLVARGLVERSADPEDRRVVRVRLTADGLRLVDEAAETHYELERQLLGSLSRKQQTALADSLRTLLIDLGDADEAPR